MIYDCLVLGKHGYNFYFGFLYSINDPLLDANSMTLCFWFYVSDPGTQGGNYFKFKTR